MANKTIYLIKGADKYGETCYKIGITQNDPQKRLKQLQTGNPTTLELIHAYQSVYGTKLEAILHNYFNLHRADSGEWFYLEQEKVNSFPQVCQQIESDLRLLHEQNSYYQDKILKTNRDY